MIIWSGRGILIPLIAIGTTLAGLFIVFPILDLFAPPSSADSPRNPLPLSLGLAAGALWWFANTIGKASEQEVVDHRTGMPVRMIRRHNLFFLPPIFWAVTMTCIAVFAFVSMWVTVLSRPMSKESRERMASRRAFEDADSLIISSRQGIAHGNSEQAKAMAEAFSKALKAARSMGVEKSGSTSIVSLTKGQFPTYCLLTPQRCVFMVHVPDLRHFSSEAKEFVADAGWMIANKLVDQAGMKPSAVLVGLRGSLLYDRVVIGRIGSTESIGNTVKGAEGKEELIKEFASAAAESSAKTSDKLVNAPAVLQAPPPAQVAEARGEEKVTKRVKAPVEPLMAMRTWKDTSGRTMTASFVRFTSGTKDTAEFKREDGQAFVVPMERFSAEDQNFVKSHPELKQ
jgi:hypothetical protein